MSLENNHSSSGMKILEAGCVGGLFMGTGVAIDRILEDADLSIVALSTGKQGISSFAMAVGCLFMYDLLVKNIGKETSDYIKKAGVGILLASLSAIVNNTIQKNTLGSIQESVIIGGLAFGGLLAHEFDLISKTKILIEQRKIDILQTLLHTGNTLGLK